MRTSEAKFESIPNPFFEINESARKWSSNLARRTTLQKRWTSEENIRTANENYKRLLIEKGLMDENEIINEEKLDKLIKIADIHKKTITERLRKLRRHILLTL